MQIQEKQVLKQLLIQAKEERINLQDEMALQLMERRKQFKIISNQIELILKQVEQLWFL